MRLLLGVVLAAVVASQVSAQVQVDGYVKKDGTYVAPHYRSAPDSSPTNNYSYPGNTNPYSGRQAAPSPSYNPAPYQAPRYTPPSYQPTRRYGY